MRKLTVKVAGFPWPNKLGDRLGDFILMGPANKLGAWRWYERRLARPGEATILEKIKVDHNLEVIGCLVKVFKGDD